MLIDRLRDRPDFGTDTPAAYMLELATSVDTVATVADYAREVLDKRQRRDKQRQCLDWAHQYGNGHATKDVDKDLFATATDWQRERQSAEPQWEFTAGELCDRYPRLNEPVIDGALRRGETGNLISGSKAGKSWLLDYIMLCKAVGRAIFNRFATTPGKSLIIDNELHEPTIGSRLRFVADAMGLLPNDWRHQIKIWPMRGKRKSLFDIESMLLDTEPGTYDIIGYDA